MLIVGYDINMINRLKKDLVSRFAMKYLRLVQQILGMRIIHEKKNKICVYHKKIILKMC